MRDGIIRVRVVGDEIVVAGLQRVFSAEEDLVLVEHAGGSWDVCDADVVVVSIDEPSAEPVVQKLAENESCSILVLSALDDDAFAAQVLAAGASGYILRESGATAVVNAVRAVATGSVLVSRRLARRSTFAIPISEEPDDRPVAGRFTETLAVLSDRERDVVRLVADGRSNGEIAQALHLSESTVKTHLSNSSAKLKISGRVALALLINDVTRGPQAAASQ
ncbi:response regulator transcription factor [Rathayibacter agropyri]|uniref:response regulator transcription factor n=1 Tax=Rathayibacter agropyri TaxID=1634927 RepID=UPI001567711C|nr:response regulator transcription factor [Rathayibacter agropyri]NRD09023.1 response regulator transcription factor [Rathayibacter agropyri]